MALLIRARARAVCPLLAAALVVCGAQALKAQDATEAELKAVFLFNFAKYVDWPSARPGTSESIRICVPNDPPFLALVRSAVQGETVNGRPLRAVDLEGLDGARDCHILYVGNSTTADAAEWLGAVCGRETLTVGDGTLANGVVIAFVRDSNRVRFDISRAAENRQRLEISSKLLRLARRVQEL